MAAAADRSGATFLAPQVLEIGRWNKEKRIIDFNPSPRGVNLLPFVLKVQLCGRMMSKHSYRESK